MIRTATYVCLTAAALLVAAGCGAPNVQYYGEKMTLGEADELDVAAVLAEPDTYLGKRIRVSGTVKAVCEGKGCWIALGAAESDETLRVSFTCPPGDDDRVIPMDAMGQRAVVEGTLEGAELSEESARHMAQMAGKSEEEIAKIVGPQKENRIISPAAAIHRGQAAKGCGGSSCSMSSGEKASCGGCSEKK